jgi:hypothetical protein
LRFETGLLDLEKEGTVRFFIGIATRHGRPGGELLPAAM